MSNPEASTSTNAPNDFLSSVSLRAKLLFP